MDRNDKAIKKVAKLTKELQGERTQIELARDTGISKGYISEILNEKCLVSADILRKLASSESLPRNGITVEDLMVAAGYQDEYTIDAAAKLLASDFPDGDEKNKSEINKKTAKFEATARGIIYKALDDKSIPFSSLSVKNETVRGAKADLEIALQSEKISQWWYIFKIFPNESTKLKFAVVNTLGRLCLTKPDADRKISIVTDQVDAFESFAGMVGNLAYRGELSVIHIDTDEYRVVNEVYLTHYNLGDNVEIKLV